VLNADLCYRSAGSTRSRGLRLVELEGDRARWAPGPISNWRTDAISKQVRRSILIGGILTLKETGSRDRC